MLILMKTDCQATFLSFKKKNDTLGEFVHSPSFFLFVCLFVCFFCHASLLCKFNSKKNKAGRYLVFEQIVHLFDFSF